MKDETIYKLWTNFINDDKYKIYFQSQYDIFISVLNKLKIYIDTNKKRPSCDSKDKNIKSLGKWIWTKQSNYNKKTENMKDENIYKEWTNFINDDKYKEYMLSPYDSFIINFNKLKIYIDINNKRPSEDSKDNEIRILGKWTNHQGTNYKKKQQNMKNENIYKLWSEFINDTKYNKYFQSMEGLFNIKLNELKLYMDINKNKPSSHSKDANIKIIGSWISTQKKKLCK